MTRVLALVACLVLGGACTAGAAAPPRGLAGSWVGTYRLVGDARIAFDIRGRQAMVALDVGHAGVQTVALTADGSRVRFRLPGRPAPLVFDGRLRSSGIVGTVRQGEARGGFQARRGRAPELVARGLYTAGGLVMGVVDDPYGPARLVDLDSGRVRALFPLGSRFLIGAGFATREPSSGAATFDAQRARIEGTSMPRIAVREIEVRFRSAGATLSGTLTLPSGRGPHPAVAWISGSGPTLRAYLPDLEALLVRHGVAVLAYDKRGVGQSSGVYPGESPTAYAIDVLARDAAAAVRFLAAQPDVDRSRVGLAGHSQAGWIMPLAASREPRARFLIAFSGPAVTADENDLFQDLAGEGERTSALTDDEIDARVVARGPGGVDPLPWIRKLRIPALWVYGGRDRHVPPRLSALRLRPLVDDPGRDFAVADFPNANHALVETKTGLTSEMLRSDTFAPGLFARVGEWLRSHGLARG